MTKKLILGIDPGLSGAMAYYCLETKKLIFVNDMPLKNEKGEKRELDAEAIAIAVDGMSAQTIMAVVEDVHAMTYTDRSGQVRGQGAASSFAFGKSAGILHGILAANYIAMQLVRPTVWKALMGLTSDKNKSRELASKLFPDSRNSWALKKNDGRAEAALLAYFGATKLKAFWMKS